MATPHVAGLAALVWGYQPNLTLAEVKNAILSKGDPVASLNGKTVTGKRINAQKALQAVTPAAAKAITLFNFAGLTPNVTGSINETNHTIALTVPFGTGVTSLVPTIDITGASVSPNTGVAQNFTNPVTYTVTATDALTQDYIVTITVEDDPNSALLAADMAALTDSLIQGANANLVNVTGPLTNPLPAVGSVNSSLITWASSNTGVISNDGQTITRPVFESGDVAVALTATLAKGTSTATKVFNVIVLKLPTTVVTSNGGGGGGGDEPQPQAKVGKKKGIASLVCTRSKDTKVKDFIQNTAVPSVVDRLFSQTFSKKASTAESNYWKGRARCDKATESKLKGALQAQKKAGGTMPKVSVVAVKIVSLSAKVPAIFKAVYGRNPSASEKKYWLSRLNSKVTETNLKRTMTYHKVRNIKH